MKLVERATQLLMQQSHPVLMGEICDGLGLSRGMSASLALQLREHLGERLVGEVRRRPGQVRKYTYWHIEGVQLAPERRHYVRFTPPDDLWRAWVAPGGVQTARLGVDLEN